MSFGISCMQQGSRAEEFGDVFYLDQPLQNSSVSQPLWSRPAEFLLLARYCIVMGYLTYLVENQDRHRRLKLLRHWLSR